MTHKMNKIKVFYAHYRAFYNFSHYGQLIQSCRAASHIKNTVPAALLSFGYQCVTF